MNSELYVGLMSGTSVDGVDAVVVSIDDNSIQLIESLAYPITDELRQQILAVGSNQKTTIAEIGLIDHKLGKLYATTAKALLKKAQLDPQQITAIGNHGQTVFHQPTGNSCFTVQLGDANLIAALTGIDTVADFRRIDMAYGGQGAPLVPAFHQYLFATRNSTTVVLNIGGIANISVIPANSQTAGKVTGFDTGPGNLLMDAWCEKHTGQQYDHNAQWATQGQINDTLLKQLLSDPYLKTQPPKSTGREYYNLNWLQNHSVDQLDATDVQRTLAEFTALSIAQHIKAYQHGPDCELLVCGGGANNPLLMQLIRQHLADWLILPTSDRGIPADFMEAMAFAWLARQKIHNLPSNLPAVTGAECHVSLGVLYSSASHKVETNEQ